MTPPQTARALTAILRMSFWTLLLATPYLAFVSNVRVRETSFRRSPCRELKGKVTEMKSTPSWRLEIDDFMKSISPWGSIAEAEIIAGDLVKQLPAIAADLRDSIQRGALISEVLVGESTEAQFTIEGLTALNRQLRQDILPEVLEGSRISRVVPRAGTHTTKSSSANGRTGPMEGVAEGLYSIKSTVRGLTPQKIRQGLQSVVTESENIFSRTPSGLYSPDYTLEDAREGFEVRRYASYTVCTATMEAVDNAATGSETLDGNVGVTDGSGQGFNTLAGYLFGDNEQERPMDMTTPVNIDVSPGGRTMSFVMPQDIPAGEAPIPRNPRVRVDNVPTELLAIREFPGLATDGEVERQIEALLWALQMTSASSSPWCAEDLTGKAYRLMQFNPPYTLPWRRTNAIAVRVCKG